LNPTLEVLNTELIFVRLIVV